MKYVMMFVETEQYEKDIAALSAAEREELDAAVYRWFAEHGSKITNRGAKLRSASTATTVRLGDGDPIVTDGPFVEGKEVVSGFIEVDVADLDEALRIARTWPACPTIEIRPVDTDVMETT